MLDVLDVSRDEICIDDCGEVIFIVQLSPEVRIVVYAVLRSLVII